MGSNYAPFAAPQHKEVLPSYRLQRNNCGLYLSETALQAGASRLLACASRRLWQVSKEGGRQPWHGRADVRSSTLEETPKNFMTFQHFAGAAYRALTFPKDGPSLYDVCDPLLLKRRWR